MTSKKKWASSFAHAFALLILSLLWLHTPYTYGDEKFLIKWCSVIKRMALHIDEDSSKDRFLFINLAHEKALIPLEDELGNEVITDRQTLAKFFAIQKRHPNAIKFTVCDVFLKGRSENDSLLATTLSGIQNVIFPTILDDNDYPVVPAIKVPYALADYASSDQSFVKFKLLQGHNNQSIPVYLYEKLQQKTITNAWGINWEGNKPCLNSVIIDYKIRPQLVFQDKAFPAVNLSELLLLPEDILVKEFLQDKIVIMGDFKHDQHNTFLGSMPGSLILLNVYLALVIGTHIITWGWFLFMLIAFTIYSRVLIFRSEMPEKKPSKWFARVLESVSWLSIISIGSYFFFNIAIQVLFLTIYTSFILFIKKNKQAQLPITRLNNWINYFLKHK